MTFGAEPVDTRVVELAGRSVVVYDLPVPSVGAVRSATLRAEAWSSLTAAPPPT